ncbi:MAG TPA: PqiC family protein [Steroidobacteraceae bacterium]|nr:PqiC family protein [Steroidobacteraceae bacterium]
MTPRLIAVLLVPMLAACASSPPTHFFTLEPVAPGAATTAVRGHAPLKVDAVHIPPALDRSSIVRGMSGNQLQISSRDRWAGDLGETIRRVLTQDLARRLPPGMVIAPDAPPPANARGIVVDILTFQPRDAGQVVLDADWTLLQGSQSHPVLSRSEHLTTAAAPTAQGETAAMSTLLGQLADRITAGIGSAASGGNR